MVAKRRKSEFDKTWAFPSHVLNGALEYIDAYMHNTVLNLVGDPPFDAHQLLRWTFPNEVRRQMETAYGVIETTAGSYTSYTIASDTDITFHCLERERLATPKAETVQWTNPEQFREFEVRIRNIQNSFALVKFVFTWLNVNTTREGIRYCWPSAMPFVPGLLDATLGRPPEIAGLGSILPLIRETASTVTSALFLPTRAPELIRKKGNGTPVSGPIDWSLGITLDIAYRHASLKEKYPGHDSIPDARRENNCFSF